MEKYLAKQKKQIQDPKTLSKFVEYLKSSSRNPSISKTSENFFHESTKLPLYSRAYCVRSIHKKVVADFRQRYQQKESVTVIAKRTEAKELIQLVDRYLRCKTSPLELLVADQELFLNSNENFKTYFKKTKFMQKMRHLFKIYQFAIFRQTSVCFDFWKVLERYFSFKSCIRNEYIKALLSEKNEEEILKMRFDINSLNLLSKKQMIFEVSDLTKIPNGILKELSVLRNQPRKSEEPRLSRQSIPKSLPSSRSHFHKQSASPDLNDLLQIKASFTYKNQHNISDVIVVEKSLSNSSLILTNNLRNIFNRSVKITTISSRKIEPSPETSRPYRVSSRTKINTDRKTPQHQNLPTHSLDVAPKFSIDLKSMKHKLLNNHTKMSKLVAQPATQVKTKLQTSSLLKSKNFQEAMIASQNSKHSILQTKRSRGSINSQANLLPNHGSVDSRASNVPKKQLTILNGNLKARALKEKDLNARNGLSQSRRSFTAEQLVNPSMANTISKQTTRVHGLYQQFTSRVTNENRDSVLGIKNPKTNRRNSKPLLSPTKRFPNL